MNKFSAVASRYVQRPALLARHEHGFTLIELMITCVIIGILAAIAVPNYTEYVRKGRRSDAMAALTNGAQVMERYYTENMTYATAPASLVPATSNGGFYAVAFTAKTANGWTLTASPLASTAQKNDKCGTFSLTNTGVKNVTGGTATSADCWK